jgi:hypothetical protein
MMSCAASADGNSNATEESIQHQDLPISCQVIRLKSSISGVLGDDVVRIDERSARIIYAQDIGCCLMN